MTFRSVPLILELLIQGKYQRLIDAVWFYVYKGYFWIVFKCIIYLSPRRIYKMKWTSVKTNHPVAFKSPDHIVPWGTKHDNSSHKGFVILMDRLIKSRGHDKAFLDLGCSGGQLVKDFHDIGWFSIGLEGSDFSLKYKRANWPGMGGKNLFTCDITKSFKIFNKRKNQKFQLITAWEVLEHIKTKDLPALFRNIVYHLEPGGYFMASTTSLPDVHDGVELHQTKMTNKKWRFWIKTNVRELEPVNVGLKYYQQVRYNSERSFLVYRKKGSTK